MSKRYISLFLLFTLVISILCVSAFGNNEKSFVAAFSKIDKIGATICFKQEDFTANIINNNTLDAIIISELPSSGRLLFVEQELNVGDIVDFENIDKLTFVSDIDNEIVDIFKVFPVFSKTGTEKEAVSITVQLTDRQNYAPVAVNRQYKTYVNVDFKGDFSAVDSDGEECIFSIKQEPKKGKVSISGKSFLYQPINGKTGKDTFEYIATDSAGNISNVAKITIDIIKPASKQTFIYNDMLDSRAHFAALYLREEGILIGETFGEENFFYPDTPVTRAQFIALVASVSDMALPTVAVGTGLSDNDDIPKWAVPYVAAAINCGVISGENVEDGNKVFRANDYITRAEAAAILDRAIGLNDDNRVMSFSDSELVPVWAEQSLVNTTSNGIVSVFEDNTVRAESHVSREDAASMLYESICFIEKQNKSKGFWEKLFGK